jgi:predicted DNA-binding protein
MRVNARLDDETQKQLEYLVEATGESVSHVVRESVARYYDEVRARQPALKHFGRLIGKGHSGRSDIASNYKQVLTESLEAKHGLRRK